MGLLMKTSLLLFLTLATPLYGCSDVSTINTSALVLSKKYNAAKQGRAINCDYLVRATYTQINDVPNKKHRGDSNVTLDVLDYMADTGNEFHKIGVCEVEIKEKIKNFCYYVNEFTADVELKNKTLTNPGLTSRPINGYSLSKAAFKYCSKPDLMIPQ